MSLVLQDARLVDGVAAEARDHVDIVVDGDRIARVEPHADRDWAAADTIIDASGRTVLPGFIDCHTHYTMDARLEVTDGIEEASHNPDWKAIVIGSRNARLALEAGVTTARSAGVPHGMDIRLRDAIAAGDVPGPRILAAGPTITITGGHGWKFGLQVDGVHEMVKAARAIARDGADVFKVVSSEAAMLTSAVAGVEEMTTEEIGAVVREATRLRRRVLSHAQNSAAVIASARGGVASVEHAFLASREALEVLAESGAFLTPTLDVTDVYRTIPGISEARRARQREIEVAHRRSCQTAVELGIPLVTGTDCGVRGVLPDMIWREIWLLNDHGLSPMEAIKGATSRAARLLGLEEEVGSVEVGMRADLVVVDSDPLSDLRRLEAPRLVIKAGRVSHRRPDMTAA